jgi:hypothetical protein
VPTGLRLARNGDTFHYVFTGLETGHITVGYKMLTGVIEEVKFRRDGRDWGTSTSESPLLSEIPPPPDGYSPNTLPAECRITIYETDQPSGYHVEPSDGKYYKVLWTRTFEGPFE